MCAVALCVVLALPEARGAFVRLTDFSLRNAPVKPQRSAGSGNLCSPLASGLEDISLALTLTKGDVSREQPVSRHTRQAFTTGAGLVEPDAVADLSPGSGVQPPTPPHPLS